MHLQLEHMNTVLEENKGMPEKESSKLVNIRITERTLNDNKSELRFRAKKGLKRDEELLRLEHNETVQKTDWCNITDVRITGGEHFGNLLLTWFNFSVVPPSLMYLIFILNIFLITQK